MAYFDIVSLALPPAQQNRLLSMVQKQTWQYTPQDLPLLQICQEVQPSVFCTLFTLRNDTLDSTGGALFDHFLFLSLDPRHKIKIRNILNNVGNSREKALKRLSPAFEIHLKQLMYARSQKYGKYLLIETKEALYHGISLNGAHKLLAYDNRILNLYNFLVRKN